MGWIWGCRSEDLTGPYSSLTASGLPTDLVGVDNKSHNPSISQLIRVAQALQQGASLANERGMPAVSVLLLEDCHLVLARLLRDFPSQVTLRGGTVTAAGFGKVGTISDAVAAALGCREGTSSWMN